MDNLQLDCALSYLNEGKVTTPIELLSEQIDYEITQFNSLVESYNVITEKVSLKTIFDKIKELIHKLLEKIRLAFRSIREKFMKAKKKKNEKIEAEDKNKSDSSKNNEEDIVYTYPEIVIEYNGIKYNQFELDKLISVITTQLGGNHMFNIMSYQTLCGDTDKLREAFDNFRHYDTHTKFNTNVTRTIEKHEVNQTQLDNYRETALDNMGAITKEFKWADKILKDWDKLSEKLKHNADIAHNNYPRSEVDEDAIYRMQVATYMIHRMDEYINILNKIGDFYTVA